MVAINPVALINSPDMISTNVANTAATRTNHEPTVCVGSGGSDVSDSYADSGKRVVIRTAHHAPAWATMRRWMAKRVVSTAPRKLGNRGLRTENSMNDSMAPSTAP